MSAHDDNMISSNDENGSDVLAPTWTADGHLDEGTIHAWIDGAFDAASAAAVAAHVDACSDCQGQVAEAHGFVAGASRVVRGLDAVPAHVVPQEDVARTASRIVAAAADHTRVDLRASRVRRAWYTRTAVRAAAALLISVGGGAYVLSTGMGDDVTVPVAFDSARVTLSDAPAATAVAPTGTAPVTPSAASSRESDRNAESVAQGVMKATTAKIAPPAAVSAVIPSAVPPAAPAPLRDVARGKEAAAAADADVLSRERRANTATDVAAMPARSFAPPPVPAPSAVSSASPTVSAGGVGGRGVAGGVAKSAAALEQSTGGIVSGLVVDPRNVPVVGAAVSISGTTIGTTTNARGEFDLRTQADTATLQVRRLGYISSRLPLITRSTDTVRTRVMLRESNQALSAVVVTSDAAVRQDEGRSRDVCWEVRVNGQASVTRSVALLPRAIMSTDLLAGSPVAASLLGWPATTDRTPTEFVRDASGSLVALGLASDARVTIRLARRGQSWEGTATQVRDGITGEYRVQLVLTDATMCKP